MSKAPHACIFSVLPFCRSGNMRRGTRPSATNEGPSPSATQKGPISRASVRRRVAESIVPTPSRISEALLAALQSNVGSLLIGILCVVLSYVAYDVSVLSEYSLCVILGAMKAFHVAPALQPKVGFWRQLLRWQWVFPIIAKCMKHTLTLYLAVSVVHEASRLLLLVTILIDANVIPITTRVQENVVQFFREMWFIHTFFGLVAAIEPMDTVLILTNVAQLHAIPSLVYERLPRWCRFGSTTTVGIAMMIYSSLKILRLFAADH
jgi:hypothetical protein